MRMKKSISVVLLLALLVSTLSVGALVANAGATEKTILYKWEKAKVVEEKTVGYYSQNVLGEGEPSSSLGWISVCTPSSTFDDEGNMSVNVPAKEDDRFASGSCNKFQQYELSCSGLPAITEGYIDVKNNSTTNMKFQLGYDVAGDGKTDWVWNEIVIAAGGSVSVSIDNAEGGSFKVQTVGTHASATDWWFEGSDAMFELSPIYAEEEVVATTTEATTTEAETTEATTTEAATTEAETTEAETTEAATTEAETTEAATTEAATTEAATTEAATTEAATTEAATTEAETTDTTDATEVTTAGPTVPDTTDATEVTTAGPTVPSETEATSADNTDATEVTTAGPTIPDTTDATEVTTAGPTTPSTTESGSSDVLYKWEQANMEMGKAMGWYASNDHFPDIADTPIDNTWSSYCNSEVKFGEDGSAVIDVKKTENQFFESGYCTEFSQYEFQCKGLPEISGDTVGYMSVKNNSNIDIKVQVLYDRSDDDTTDWKVISSDVIAKGETGVIEITNALAGGIKLQIQGSKIGENWWFTASDAMYEISPIRTTAQEVTTAAPTATESTTTVTEATTTETEATTTATTTNTTPTENTTVEPTTTSAVETTTEPTQAESTTVPNTTALPFNIDIDNDDTKGEIEQVINADGSVTLSAKVKDEGKYLVLFSIDGDYEYIDSTDASITFKASSAVKVEVMYIPNVDYGDVNGDGKVTAADVLLMRKHIAGQDVELNLDAADVNLDDKVTAADVLMVRKYIAGQDIELGWSSDSDVEQ